MSDALTQIFAKKLAGNRGNSHYGIRAALEDDGKRIVIWLTFKANARYCCAEAGCHLWPFGEEFWLGLRHKLAEAGLSPSREPLTLRVRVIVEQGALLTQQKALGMPEESPAYEYENDFREDDILPATQT